MTDKKFVEKLKVIADESEVSENEKKEKMLLIAYACDTEEHERLITEKLKKDGNTLESLTEYVLSILPPIEFVNEDEE